MEDKQKELLGTIKEMVTDMKNSSVENKAAIEALREAEEVRKEADAKRLEEDAALKARLDAMQEKRMTLNQNTGEGKYIFKGYNISKPSKNFNIDIDKSIRDEAAANMVKALTSSNTGAYTVPVEYSSALLGLAELSSVALQKCRVMNVNTTSIKMPVKGTRATVDSQAFGTANAGAATALAQLTFTIDKRIGAYEVIYNDILADSMFDVVGMVVEPFIAEAIGQNIDGEVFVGATEFTTDCMNGTAYATASGVSATQALVTFANITTMQNTLERERGLVGQWFGSRLTKNLIDKLVDTYGLPVYANVPITDGLAMRVLGSEFNIVPAMSASPSDGEPLLYYGDPSHYIIALRQGIVFEVNPYITMKEGTTQFIGYARADGNIDNAGAFLYMSRSD